MKYTCLTVSVKIMLLLLYSLSFTFNPVEADEIKTNTRATTYAKNKMVNGSDANADAHHGGYCDKDKHYPSVKR